MKKELMEYGQEIARLNKIELSEEKLSQVIDKFLENEEFKGYYKVNKEIYKEVVFNFVCFGDE